MRRFSVNLSLYYAKNALFFCVREREKVYNSCVCVCEFENLTNFCCATISMLNLLLFLVFAAQICNRTNINYKCIFKPT